MLDQLVNLVKQFSGDAVVNNPDIPNEHNENVMAEATHSISGGLQNAIAGGGLQNVLGLLTGSQSGGNGIMSNPIVQSIIGSFAGKLLGKYGISPQIAGPLASSLIPNVINGLISKTNDANDNSFSLQSIIGGLTGGGAQQQQQAGGGGFDISSILSSLTGGGAQQQQQQSSGGLQDIIAQFTGGALQQRANQTQQGGLFDIIKGFMK